MDCSLLVYDVLVDVSNRITPMIPVSRFGQDSDLQNTQRLWTCPLPVGSSSELVAVNGDLYFTSKHVNRYKECRRLVLWIKILKETYTVTT